MLFPKDLTGDPEQIETRGLLIRFGRRQVLTKDGRWQYEYFHDVQTRIGILTSLYFEDGWQEIKRRALLTCLEEYLSLFPDGVTHYDTGNGGWPRRWKGDGIPLCYLDPKNFKRDRTFHFSMKVYKETEHDKPSLYHFIAFGHDESDNSRRPSGAKIHFPPSFVFADPDRFIDLLRRWSERLDVVHGSAGLGVLTIPGTESYDAFSYPWLIQYPALEYDAMGCYFSEVRHSGAHGRPRSSNWLTILGADNVALLGGRSVVERALAPETSMTQYGAGIILRACALPALGDPANGGIPEGYRTIARLIKPIRFEGYRHDVIRVPRDMEVEGAETTLTWIRRFD